MMIAQYATRKINDYYNLSNVRVGLSPVNLISVKVYIRKEEVKLLGDMFAPIPPVQCSSHQKVASEKDENNFLSLSISNLETTSKIPC